MRMVRNPCLRPSISRTLRSLLRPLRIAHQTVSQQHLSTCSGNSEMAAKQGTRGPFCEAKTYPVHASPTPLALVELSSETKHRLLTESSPLQPTMSPRQVLENVRNLDSWAADRLGSKGDALQRFRFKTLQAVVAPSGDSRPASSAYQQAPNVAVHENPLAPVDSFLMLSYCWHYGDWDVALGLQHKPAVEGGFASSEQEPEPEPEPPVAPAMFAALLDERRDESEAFWLDQWCIDQTNEQEKVDAIGSMDLLYSNARHVIVCLEDVRLTPANGDILLRFGDFLAAKDFGPSVEVPREELLNLPWSDEDKGHLWEATAKLFTARWFTRAWCAHEFWMGREHIFLAPVTADPARPGASVTILRFNSTFLANAHFATSIWLPATSLTSAERIQRHWQRFVEPTHPYYWRGRLGSYDAQVRTKIAFTHATSFVGAFGMDRVIPPHLATFAVIDSLNTSRSADKLSISLNASRTGLYLTGSQDLSRAEAAWIATVVALASGDSTALAVVGQPLLASGEAGDTDEQLVVGNKLRRETGWACEPRIDRYVRLGLGDAVQLASVPMSLSPAGLELDVIRLGMGPGAIRGFGDVDAVKTFLAGAALDWFLDAGARITARDNGGEADNQAASNPAAAAEARVASGFRLYEQRQHRGQMDAVLDYRHLKQALACLVTGGREWTIACAYQARQVPGDRHKYLRIAQNPALIDAAFDALTGVAIKPLAEIPADLREMLDLEGTKLLLQRKHEQREIATALHALITVADGLVRTVVGEKAEYEVAGEIDPTYEIQISLIDTTAHGGIVVFAPPAAGGVEYEIVCPDVLRRPGDNQLAAYMRRGWIVEEDGRVGDGGLQRYRLLGKTALFMPLAFGDGDQVFNPDSLGRYESERIIVGG
ncbi:heterokaryon incompatibility protein-domain-containing protein [Lasiosphaeria ovina]|uniref:Heterokaryon incompatibility protein-domain-containing protein n=1 Tax=Lasiosphaeria ovina TaxID=92902 RepID=A0AAE0TWI4_9PEZI|nr:heterokaryon incompatibility protein-domain-containing protein [Lasiosphaeria ovina]